MNIPDKEEVQAKRSRVLQYLEEKGYEALILGRQDNFAWFTDGGNNRVIIPSENGFALLVITKDNVYLVAQVMDGPRIMNEELAGLEIEYVPLHWYEQSRGKKAMELAKGVRVAGDIQIQGADCVLKDIYALQYPMTEKELEKLRWLGAKTEEIIAKVAFNTKPGMTEHEIEAMFLYEYGKENIQTDVLLIGSDERIFKYRHPNPSEKRIEKYVMLHPAVRKWGLHANVTRLIYFGEHLPEEIARKYEAVCQIEAAAIAMCEPGIRFSDILAEEKMLYSKLGFEDEWRCHYQGGITGYMVSDPTLALDPANIVRPNQAYDWFITITGTKGEEVSINDGKDQQIISVTGKWPTSEYHYRGKSFKLPQIQMF